MIQLDYVVVGNVQGVFFRKFTLAKALSLGLKGEVYNADDLSVRGTAVGDREVIDDFRKFLRFEGSPGSSIQDAFFEEKEVETAPAKYQTFEITR
jgi:acylphosphatase